MVSFGDERNCRNEMELMNLKYAGAYLGVSKRTARRLVDRRDIPYYKVSGSIRLAKADLDKYLKSKRTEVMIY